MKRDCVGKGQRERKVFVSFFLAKIKPQTQIEKKQEGTYSLPRRMQVL